MNISEATSDLYRRGISLIDRWPALYGILGLCLFAAAYYLAYRYGMSFSDTIASPFWFPDSVLLCACLWIRAKRWWLLILVSLPIRLFSDVASDVPTGFLLATFVIDSAKGPLAAFGLRRLMKNPTRFESVRDFALFCVIAVLLIPALSAFGGAATRHVFFGNEYWSTWKQWFAGDALAQLVVTPLILYWILGIASTASAIRARLLEVTLLGGGIIITSSYLQYVGSRDFTDAGFYAPVPFLFWAAVRFGMGGASAAVAIVAAFTVEAAIAGHGPFASQSPVETATALQIFLLWRAAPLFIIAVLIDQGRIAERSLREVEKHLFEAEKLEAIGRVTSGFAHDLGNVLMAVQMNLDLLRSDTSSEREEALHNAIAEVERGSQAIRSLMSFARRGSLDTEIVNTKPEIEQVARLLEQAIGSHSAMDLSIEEGLWPIKVNANQLELALFNLAINARDAMPDGGTLRVAARNVSLSGSPDRLIGDFVEISVSDTGCGMSPEIAAKAIEPFFTTKEAGNGTGLGVSQVYGFAKNCGGTMTLTSAVGRGTTVTIYIPKHSASDNTVPRIFKRRRSSARQHVDEPTPGRFCSGSNSVLGPRPR